MIRTIRCLILWLALPWQIAVAQDTESRLTVSLHERMLNRMAAAALPHTETRRYAGEMDLAVTRRPYEVAVRYTVQAVEAKVRPTHIEFKARVRVQGPNVDHAAVAQGRLDAGVVGGKLRLTASGMTLPLTIAPFGVPFDLGSVPTDDFLPVALRTFEIDLAAIALPVELPAQRTATLKLTSARVELDPPFLRIHSTIGL